MRGGEGGQRGKNGKETRRTYSVAAAIVSRRPTEASTCAFKHETSAVQ